MKTIQNLLRCGNRRGPAKQSFGKDTRGNVAIIFAVASVPMLLAVGSGVDYGLAIKRQARMNAAADAAALYAVTPTMMSNTSTVAKAAAIAFFNSQVASLTGTNYVSTNLTVTVTDNSSASTLQRTATVAYSATSNNSFSTILNDATLPIKGSSTATASVSPNIDFYLMLDTSPSMAIAATTAGIATMVANTTAQGGCGFACHESNPGADNLGNPGGIDNYQLARNLGVTLRIDMVQQAVQNLTSTATQTSASTGAAYRMAGYTFNVGTSLFMPLTSNMTTALAATSGIQLLEVYSNNHLTSSNSNNDEDTNFDQAFNTINGAMPTPGTGSNAAGDSPQEVLFIVTDGVADTASGSSRVYTPFGPSATWCTTIKNRGIRIAVLYTTYNPLPTNSWYNTYIAAEQPTIGTTAQACASPGLFFQVDTGGDISAAMTTLFMSAVSSAHLTH